MDKPRKADTAHAIKFLSEFHEAKDPWHLFAIKKGLDPKIIAKTFHPSSHRGGNAESWILEHNEDRDIYFAPNPIGVEDRKASKYDVVEIRNLWIDLDPVGGQDRSALLRSLKTDRPKNIPEPSWIIDSGRGAWAFWHLDRARSMYDAKSSSQEHKIHAIQARNKGIVQAFGGKARGADGCHNVDRIARLPGTINHKTGRCAKVVAYRNVAYALKRFAAVTNNKNGNAPQDGFKRLPKIDKIIDIDDLDLSKSRREKQLRVTIKRGRYRDKWQVDGKLDRSRATFAVCCELIRAGIDPTTIAAILLNKNYKISEHVYSQSDPDRCAMKHALDAQRKVSSEDAVVNELNKSYAVVPVGGKTAIMKLDGDDLQFMSYHSLQQWLANRTTDDNVPVAKHWMQHPNRRQYKGLVFAPNQEKPGYFNLWRGFSVAPRKGDWSKFRNHMFENVCWEDKELYRWVIAWWAQMFRQPERKMGTSLILRGEPGVGKTKVGEVFGSLLHPAHWIVASQPRYITGRFNSHEETCLLLQLEEGFWAGDKEAESVLKHMITSEHQTIEYKGYEPIQVNSYVRLFITGNADWQVPAALKERRHAVLDVNPQRQRDNEYFAAIDEQMDNGGREALLYHLLNFDLSRVNLREIPKTEALLDQKIHSMKPEELWLYNILSSGRLPGGGSFSVSTQCRTEELFADYLTHTGKLGHKGRRSTETEIGAFLKKMLGATFTKLRDRRRGIHIYEFQPLKTCRRQFERQLDQEIEWDKSEEWGE